MKALTPALLIALAACSSQTPAENAADQLNEAAGQSDPAAAEVLENAADQVRDQNSLAPADGALEDAANASSVPQPEGTMPPPKVPPDP